ncbi:MAG TPA: serine--tRNA ligase [Candidatus Paceibacterota bacterium]|nr:serine--tRNA ligase [Candidatus Paceibacterota bacterium]
MLDIKFIRENPDLIKEAARKKHVDFDVNELLSLDARHREILNLVEKLRSEQNKLSEAIPTKAPAEKEKLVLELRQLKEHIKEKEEGLRHAAAHFDESMLRVPNIPDVAVPEGLSDADNQEIRKWGDLPTFPFTPKDHITLLESKDLVDFSRGSKISGFRGYFLKNAGALLCFALWQFTLESLVKKGFTPIIAPSKVRRDPLKGCGFIPQHEEEVYKLGEDEYLSGTAEVPVTSYFMDEVLNEKDLPKKFIAFSPCFRREAGSYGKDVKGLIRVHEFFKLEQVILCEGNHETSVRFHEELTKNSEEIVQALGLPYRVVVNCGGDLGLGQVKKYDIEVWMPSQEKYRETHSASYFHDFQTRRLNIRYRGHDNELRFVHSLNNTAVATPRLIACLVENYQEADGSIRVPEVLQKYVGLSVIK